jgi:hypothetical protein
VLHRIMTFTPAKKNSSTDVQAVRRGFRLTAVVGRIKTSDKGNTMERTIKFTANARRWRDKINGNTYHSVRITRHRDGATLVCPFTYGYGEQYRYTALDVMAKAGWIPDKYNMKQPQGGTDCIMYERENNYPILWNVSDGLKRDCVANGKD